MLSRIFPCTGAPSVSLSLSNMPASGSLAGESHLGPGDIRVHLSSAKSFVVKLSRAHIIKPGRFPFYWEIKTLFLLFLALPQTQVSTLSDRLMLRIQ